MTFDIDDVLFLKTILKHLVRVDGFSIALAQYFHNSIALNEMRHLKGNESQSDESLKARIAELEKEQAHSFFSNADRLRDAFAKKEFDHDQLEAWIARLDREFPDPSPPSQPASGA